MDRFKFRVWDNEEKEFINSWETNCCNFDSEACRLGNWETVEQCTGLKDKNGKFIFEGDIVECNHEHRGIIRWDDYTEGGARFYSDFGCDICHDKQRWNNYTVIGNIHENLELCEG